MDDDLKRLGLSVERMPNLDKLSNEDIQEMYEVLRAVFIEIHEINAQREFPKNNLECRVGHCLASIHATTLNTKQMLKDRERLKKEYGEPASSKLRRLREYICSIAPDLMHD